jgi:hypothetical protein
MHPCQGLGRRRRNFADEAAVDLPGNETVVVSRPRSRSGSTPGPDGLPTSRTARPLLVRSGHATPPDVRRPQPYGSEHRPRGGRLARAHCPSGGDLSRSKRARFGALGELGHGQAVALARSWACAPAGGRTARWRGSRGPSLVEPVSACTGKWCLIDSIARTFSAVSVDADAVPVGATWPAARSSAECEDTSGLA